MNNTSMIDAIAMQLLVLFLLSQNLKPSEDFEIQDFGYHRTWTASACAPLDMDLDAFRLQFNKYLENHNACLTAAKFGFYDCIVYPCNHCDGKHLYLSIYQ